jgi:riboflavin biosynthesis pyrimidine reductase
VDEIVKMKSEDGRNIIVYGGASFDSSLIKAGLVDEFHLFINPTAIGRQRHKRDAKIHSG